MKERTVIHWNDTIEQSCHLKLFLNNKIFTFACCVPSDSEGILGTISVWSAPLENLCFKDPGASPLYLHQSRCTLHLNVSAQNGGGGGWVVGARSEMGLSLCEGPAINCWLVQGEPRIHPEMVLMGSSPVGPECSINGGRKWLDGEVNCLDMYSFVPVLLLSWRAVWINIFIVWFLWQLH